MKLRILPRQAEKRSPIVGVILGLVTAVLFSLVYNIKAEDYPIVSKINIMLRAMELKTYDFRFRIRGSLREDQIDKNIVLLDYDDETQRWAPFPPDRSYYAEIIRALGTDGSKTVATFFDIFFFEPFGQQLNIALGDIYKEKFNKLAAYTAQDQDIVNGIKEKLLKLSEDLAKTSTQADINRIKAEMLNILSDPKLSEQMKYFNETVAFLSENNDIQKLAPNRDAKMHDAIKDAGNVFLAQIVQVPEETPYGIDDILFKTTVHDAFASILMMPAQERLKNKNTFEVDVRSAFQNLTPESIKKLIEDSAKDSINGRTPLPFKKAEIEKLKEELERKNQIAVAALKQSEKFGIELPKNAPVPIEELKKYYNNLTEITPLFKDIVEFADGLAFIRPELQQKYDGTIRMSSPVSIFQNKLYLHNTLLMITKYLGLKKDDIEFYPDHLVLKNCKFPGEKEPRTITVPLTKDSALIVNWAGKFYAPNTLQHRSFKRIYEDSVTYNVLNKQKRGEKLDPDEQSVFDKLTPEEIKRVNAEIQFFNGKLSLTGLVASGTHDLNPIPFEPRYPLVGMHANLVNTYLNQLFIKEAPDFILWIILLTFGAILGFVAGKYKQLTGALATSGTILGYGVVCIVVFSNARIWLPFIPVMMSFVFSFLFVIIYRYMTEGQEAKKMKAMFGTYVSPALIDAIIANPDMLKLGGKRLPLTAMFALASGPGLETESAEELVDRLNEYFSAMTDAIMDVGGTLDKYEGHIVMSFFGAPVEFPDHTAKACLACVDMKKKLAELHKKWTAEGKGLIYTNVGMNTGPMIAGNMGSGSRFSYTIMGDSVNLSARILGAGKQYGVSYMISGAIYNGTIADGKEIKGAKDKVVCRFVDTIVVVGKEEPVDVYEIIASKEDVLPAETAEFIKCYETGMALYKERKWDEAIAMFVAAEKANPGDRSCNLLKTRCEAYRAAPPSDKWIGEYVLTSKGL